MIALADTGDLARVRADVDTGARCCWCLSLQAGAPGYVRVCTTCARKPSLFNMGGVHD